VVAQVDRSLRGVDAGDGSIEPDGLFMGFDAMAMNGTPCLDYAKIPV